MSFSSPTSRAQRSRRILPWLLYLYALVLFAMHFVRIFDNSFWGDEGFSIGLAQMNVFEMLQVTAADNHPPLYYLFTQLLYHLLGNHGYVYHLSALIPYGLILILACTVIFRQFGLIPAVVVSTFASLTDTAIMFNVEARMYSLGAFFVLAAYLALHNILHSGKTSDWVIFSVASLCAAYTHYYALISVAFFYLALLSLLPQDKSSFKKILITYCAAVVVYLPWLLVLLPTFKRAAADWWSTFIPSPINCIGFFFNPSWTVLIFGLAFLLYFTAQAKSSSKWLFAPDTIWLLAGLLSAAGTSAVGLIVSYAFRPLFLVRYLYPLTAVVYLVFGFLLSKVRWRTILSSILILGTLVCSLPDFYQTYQREKRIDLATTQCLEVITPSQDAVLYTTNYFLDWTLFDYYFPGRVHAQIESSNTSQCFTSSDPEIWLFMEHALSDAELNAASDNGYSHTNVCNSTFAEGPGEDSFYYIYKFQKSANTAP